jgi:UDP-N-acetylmuramate--alanine ligase
VHFLGVGGAGLSPLALIHLAGGGTVSGSDREDSPRVAVLRARGARVRTGPAAGPGALAAELAGVDVVVASSALADDHPEVAAARSAGLPVLRRSQWLPALTGSYRLVAVAGSHGKTTTAAMLALVLREAGLDPTAVIGAEVAQLGGDGAVVGGGDLFVLEADEYGGAFDRLDPALTVITNVEWEHPDQFGDEAAVRRAFAAFARRTRPGGRIVACGDDAGVQAVLKALEAGATGAHPVVDYGFESARRWRAVDVRPGAGGGTVAGVLRDGVPAGTLELALPGRHVVLDALAALAAAVELGVAPVRALASLAAYTGAARRFEVLGSARVPAAAARGRGGHAEISLRVEVMDDYAHHPTEIRTTLAAARQRAGGRALWAVVQPHTFSRLAALLDDFATAFGDADRVYVTDVYAARELDDLGLHPTALAEKITAPADVRYAGWPALVDRLVADLALAAGGEGGDGADGVLLLTLGAGSITTVGPRLLAALDA